MKSRAAWTIAILLFCVGLVLFAGPMTGRDVLTAAHRQELAVNNMSEDTFWLFTSGLFVFLALAFYKTRKW